MFSWMKVSSSCCSDGESGYTLQPEGVPPGISLITWYQGLDQEVGQRLLRECQVKVGKIVRDTFSRVWKSWVWLDQFTILLEGLSEALGDSGGRLDVFCWPM